MGLCGNDPPDPAKGIIGGIQADLETFPQRRIIDAAAQLGHKVTLNIPGKGLQTFDFSNMGDADYAWKFGDQMLQELLQLQRDLGPEYVQQRIEELRLADPEGAAMREQLWNQIKSGVEAGPTDRPDLQALEDQIMAQLERGGQLDPATQSRISQGVLGGQVARGNYLGNAAASQEARAMSDASAAQLAQAQQQALAFLTGGLSPEDAAYRENQQNLANLGSFVSGETPTAQFGQLSGAQRGIVPGANVAPGLGLNPGAGAQGVAMQNQLWQAQQAGQGVNPWIAGLGGALQGANVWASLAGKGNT